MFYMGYNFVMSCCLSCTQSHQAPSEQKKNKKKNKKKKKTKKKKKKQKKKQQQKKKNKNKKKKQQKKNYKAVASFLLRPSLPLNLMNESVTSTAPCPATALTSSAIILSKIKGVLHAMSLEKHFSRLQEKL